MKILFQGDSITDVGRARDNTVSVGCGYPLLIKAALGLAHPQKYEFINKGISGDRVVDLYARIKKDITFLAPDVLSILIGVNDVWHDFAEVPNGVDAEKFFKVYDMLIEEIRLALPDVKILILEPFVLAGRGTQENFDVFSREVKARAQAARAVAEKHGATFVPLQAGFDALAEKAPASYWLSDGVHPTAMGHEFIKNEWLKAFATL